MFLIMNVHMAFNQQNLWSKSIVADAHCGQNPKVFVLQKENNNVTMFHHK
jgi:hypothetical protein